MTATDPAMDATQPMPSTTDLGSSEGVPDVVLGPATRLIWRTHNALHLEFGGRAVIVERMPQPAVRAMVSNAPSGAVPLPQDPDVQEALRDLAEDGYLWPRASGPDDMRRRPPVPRLTSELVALSTRHGERAAAVLNARSKASVAVHGHPRAGTQLAVLLAAAGVGRVRCVARGAAGLSLCAPGGVAPGDEGQELDGEDGVVRTALFHAAPEVDTNPQAVDDRPDLTVLVFDGPYDEDRRVALHADGAAHLAVSTAPDGGVVGPLVLPGLTSCLRCAEQHRRDRDPAWPALAAQLCVPRRHGTSCEVAGLSVVTGAAAGQALAFLDGEPVACIDGTIEYHPPDWRLRRRSWPPHPDCGCGGSRAGGWAE